jgi:hypothetical protein
VCRQNHGAESASRPSFNRTIDRGITALVDPQSGITSDLSGSGKIELQEPAHRTRGRSTVADTVDDNSFIIDAGRDLRIHLQVVRPFCVTS